MPTPPDPTPPGPTRRRTTPPVAGASVGYSGTPLHRKLGVTPGARVLVAAVPAGWDLMQLDPDGSAHLQTRATTAPYDVVVAFCPDLAALRRHVAQLPARITQPGRLWLCWPKKSSGVTTDVSESLVHELGLATGLVDMKVAAIDQTWSAFCFVRRVKDRTSKA